MSDLLGDRMKRAEQASRTVLPHRMPVILRVDGKAFHTLTRGCAKPFDQGLMLAMDQTAVALCNEIQGAVFAFVQSDEVSVLIHNYKRLTSEAWFDNQVQKMVSVAASIATSAFTKAWDIRACAHFDARVFVLPEVEVCNYFHWRQADATRNSIQMATRAVFSHRECDGKNTSEMQEMLHARGINWNDYPVGCKRGRAVAKVPAVSVDTDDKGLPVYVERSRWEVVEPPIFTQDRAFIEKHLAVEAEAA